MAEGVVTVVCVPVQVELGSSEAGLEPRQFQMVDGSLVGEAGTGDATRGTALLT